MSIEFKLDEKQESQLKEWQEKIKDLFGEYGLYTFSFTGLGMGTSVKVRSHLLNKSIDLSNVEDW